MRRRNAIAPSRRLAAVLAVLLPPLGCTSTPIHFYSLLPPASGERGPSPSGVTRFELEPVQVPADVDRSELVLRRGTGEVLLAEDEQWIAPLPEQLWQAVSVELERALPTESAETGTQQPRIRLQIERFEAEPGRYALIQARWRVSAGRQEVLCDGRFAQSVAPGYPALIAGYQRAVVTLADAIAASARPSALAAGRCPQS